MMLSSQRDGPSSISQRDLLVLLDLGSNLIAVILLIVVGGQQHQMVEFHSGEVSSHCAVTIACVLYGEHDQVALRVVEEVLG